jgi:hypothetical protein
MEPILSAPEPIGHADILGSGLWKMTLTFRSRGFYRKFKDPNGGE